MLQIVEMKTKHLEYLKNIVKIAAKDFSGLSPESTDKIKTIALSLNFK